MIKRIENETLLVEMETLGAELKRVWDKRGDREVLWRGDETIWSGSSPLLFPNVGRLQDDCFRINGRAWPMPMHGFARRREFDAQVQNNIAEFLLSSDDDTRKIYPYDFTLRLNYRLAGERLFIDYRVENAGGGVMYFCIGAHPGFTCSNGDKLVFAKRETIDRRVIDEKTHLLKRAGEPFLDAEREIVLNGAIFARDALVFEGLQSAGVTLLRADGSGVEMDFGGAPCLGIWSKPLEEMRYVCLEPWFGGDDPEDFRGEIHQKPYIQSLKAGECFNWTVGVRVF